MDKKLFLIDAMAMIFRAYYALIRHPRLTTEGKNTSAQFGFTTALYSLLEKENPTHIGIVFDTHAPTVRHEHYDQYKANREATPEDILLAVPDIKKIAEGFKIPCIEMDGYEADDLIGTLAKKAEKEGFKVYMVTPDKDYGQLVSENILIYKPPRKGKKIGLFGPKEVCNRWDIAHVGQVIDILGLMGDSVDNIPGVPGIGEKTAAKLLKEYPSVEEILANADQIKGKVGERIKAHKEQALLSKKLATIIVDAPIPFAPEKLQIKEKDTDKLEQVFTSLQFRTLGKRVLGNEFTIHQSVEVGGQLDLFAKTQEKAPAKEAKKADEPASLTNTEHSYYLVLEKEERKALIKKLLEQKEIAFDTETTGMDPHVAEIVGMSFSYKKGEAYYVPLPEKKEEAKAILEEFAAVFQKKDTLLVGQNIKYDLLILKRYGLTVKNDLFDTMLAHYLIDPDGRRNMDTLAFQYLNYKTQPITDLIGKKGKNQGNMRDVDPKEIVEYAGEDADITLQLKEIFVPLLKEKEVEKVFYEVEMPTVRPLISMEYEGVNLDKSILQNLSESLDTEITALEKKVYEQAGVQFNLASPKQLGDVLFKKLKLVEKPKKTKTGQYATGEAILKKLASKHEIVNDILDYRELAKLKSTYIDALPLLVNKETGRIHTSFNQAVAVTGRLSSNNPNLQNIPIRTKRGRAIRGAFVARDADHVLMSADYSQVELRIIASLAKDEHMLSAFKNGIDIHTATAAKVYKVSEDEVSKTMRSNAKSVNFGIIYGVSAYGLSQNLDISRAEAKELIDNYFEEYPAIKKYMEDQIASAKEKGYAQTILGRKRWLPDINSRNSFVRGFAERNAINMPIQGTAADIIKLAMADIEEELNNRNYRSKMVLQVHDELVFDVEKTELEEIQSMVKDKMEHAMKLEVPLDVEIGVGDNWLEAH